MRSTKVCEHTGPAILTCNSTQQIKIHDVFYGRNADDNRCHNGGSITCFNPNATQIVKNICKTNSTCTVPSIGANWNFDSTCDGLNAQLRIHYVCIARGESFMPSFDIPNDLYQEESFGRGGGVLEPTNKAKIGKKQKRRRQRRPKPDAAILNKIFNF